MVTLKISNGLDVTVEDGTTILEAAQFLGFPIPTLCYMEGLSPYGACRLCVVEIGEPGRSHLVASCTYPAEEGMRGRTSSSRVIRARRMVVELLLASAPQSRFERGQVAHAGSARALRSPGRRRPRSRRR